MAYNITDACLNCGSCEGECPVGAISAGDDKYVINADECIDVIVTAGLNRLLHALLGNELGATAGVQISSSYADDIGDTVVGQGNEFALDQAGIAANDTNCLNSHGICFIDHCLIPTFFYFI